MKEEALEQQLSGSKLIDYLNLNGIVQEMNRTFLHPIGLEIRTNQNTKEIEFWKTKDPKGFVIDHISAMHSQVFQKLLIRKHTERYSKLGFVIQITSMFRSENLKNIPALLFSPERLKIELIIKCLSIFSHFVYTKIIQKHKEKDSNIDPSQFAEDSLLRMLDANLKAKDWVDVAAIAMLLNQKEELQKGLEEIQIKSKQSYNIKGDSIDEI